MNKKIENDEKKTIARILMNSGLSDVVAQGTGTGGAYGSTPLSQTDPLFLNNRWYMISNMRQVLDQSYVEHGLIQNLVNVPVDDALRGGVDIKTKMLEQHEIEKLQATLEDEGVYEEVAYGAKWMRLFGGGGIIFMTGQDHGTPLDMSQKALQGMRIRAADMWELFWDVQNVDGLQGKLEIKPDKDFLFHYYALKVHNSRVIPLKGLRAPSFVRPRLRGWGFSVVESVVQSINQFLKSKNLTYEVLDEFKLDIFKIEGFNNALMSEAGTAAVIKRGALANQQKNYQNSLMMDAKDDHISKQLSFTGLGEVMKEIRMQIACDVRMPMSKIFGIASSGFSSGEDDIQNYNSMVESEVRFKIRQPLTQVIKLYCMREYGFIPDDLRIEFKPLRTLSAEQEENVKTQKMNRVTTAVDHQICTSEDAKNAINKDNLIPIKIETGEGDE